VSAVKDYDEFIALVSSLAVKPSTLSFVQASCVGVSFITAYCALILIGQMRAKDVVLITGASGGAGSAAFNSH